MDNNKRYNNLNDFLKKAGWVGPVLIGIHKKH